MSAADFSTNCHLLRSSRCQSLINSDNVETWPTRTSPMRWNKCREFFGIPLTWVVEIPLWIFHPFWQLFSPCIRISCPSSTVRPCSSYSLWSYSEVLTVASVVPALCFSHYHVIYPCNSSEMRDYLGGIWVITSLELALYILTHISSGPNSCQCKVAGAQ